MKTYPERPFSPSSLAEFAKTPLHYLHYCGQSKTPTVAMIKGQVFEAHLTGGLEKFVPLVLPDQKGKIDSVKNKAHISELLDHYRNFVGEPVKTDGRAWVLPGCTIVDAAIIDECAAAAKACLAQLPAGHEAIEAIAGGQTQAYAVKDGLCGYADILDRKLGIDIKFYADASPEKFARTFFASKPSREMLQAGAYAHLFGLERFAFLLVESSAPFATSYIVIEGDVLEWAKAKTLALLAEAKAWANAGKEPKGYIDGFLGEVKLELPTYIK